MSRTKFRIVVASTGGRPYEPADAVTFDVSLFARNDRDESSTFESLTTEELFDENGCVSSCLTLYPDEAWSLVSSLLASGAGRIEADDPPTMNAVEYLRERFSEEADEEDE